MGVSDVATEKQKQMRNQEKLCSKYLIGSAEETLERKIGISLVLSEYSYEKLIKSIQMLILSSIFSLYRLQISKRVNSSFSGK